MLTDELQQLDEWAPVSDIASARNRLRLSHKSGVPAAVADLAACLGADGVARYFPTKSWLDGSTSPDVVAQRR